jgi:tetratricopeptide (TPR) repeat protein
METNKVLRILFAIYLTFFSVQFALAQEEEEEEEQSELEKQMEKKEQEMENFMNAFEKSVVEKEEGDFGDPADDSIQTTPSGALAFKKLIDKTIAGLENSLPPGTVAACKAQRDYLRTSDKLGEMSVINLLQENTFSSVLLSGYAVQANNADVNAISCFGSVLNICGHPSKSIPILEYSAAVEQNLNTFSNLGDAYRRMGKLGQAESWLKRAVAMEPYEIDANLLLGQMAMQNGQDRKAINYFTHSLQGGYTSGAESYLKELKKKLEEDVDIGEILMETHKREPLNESLLISCIEMPANVKSVKSQWMPKYRLRMAAIDYYIETLQTKSQGGFETMIEDMRTQMDSRKVKTPEGLTVSCKKSYLIVSAMYKQLADTIHTLSNEYGESIAKLDRERVKDMDELLRKMNEAIDECSKSSDSRLCEDKIRATYCQIATAKLTTYLGSYASTYEKFCNTTFKQLTLYYNHGLKWAYTAYLPDQREFGIQIMISMPVAGFVREITSYASDLAKVDASSWCPPEEVEVAEDDSEDENDSIPSATVRILPVFPGDNVCTDIKVPLLVGSFQVDCKSYGLEIDVGVGISIMRESDTETPAVESIWPETNRTTIKVGAGLPTTIPETGTGLKFDASVYATVEDNMTVSDVGLMHESGLTVGGVGVGTQRGLKLGVTSGATYLNSDKGNKKIFDWKD